MGWYDEPWPQYVPVAQRRRQAAAKVEELKRSGREVAPVEISGRTITTTFWGDAWCRNLESYSDYANRLPRGRTYVRNGSVIHLAIEAQKVTALVSGTNVYSVDIDIRPVPAKQWAALKGSCAGQIDSIVELLAGNLSGRVMEVVSQRGEGLFPSPTEITLRCSCPDVATMCKHVAATLYGVGARLDREPELLFVLRSVDAAELIETAVDHSAALRRARGRTLATESLSAIFGVELDLGTEPAKPRPARKAARRRRASPTNPAAPKTPAPKDPVAPRTPVPKDSVAAKKAAAKKTAAKKTTAKKTTAKKTTAKKTTAKKTTAKSAAASPASKRPPTSPSRGRKATR